MAHRSPWGQRYFSGVYVEINNTSMKEELEKEKAKQTQNKTKQKQKKWSDAKQKIKIHK